jgi:hypothetical protein
MTFSYFLLNSYENSVEEKIYNHNYFIIGRLNFYGMLLSSFLLSLFGFYLLFLVVNYKFNKPCGCGFIFSFLSYNQHILLNFLLSFSAAAVILFNKNYFLHTTPLFFNDTSNAAE